MITINVYDGIHWNIYEILPYQRNFNFINGERSIGKSYTALSYIIDKCIEKECEFVYICRTQHEKQHGILSKSCERVIADNFISYNLSCTNENMKTEDGRVIGWCIALSEAYKIKKRSFPYVKYMIFDEYMLEDDNKSYVNGWKEPDLLLSIYHTIDREEDRVICFLLGNNTRFHNPYHLHPAFHIPFTEKGKIWVSENVLFQNVEASPKLKEKKSTSKFVKMVSNSDYGRYANAGKYIYENDNFVEKMTTSCNCIFTFDYLQFSFGVFLCNKSGIVYISDSVDETCRFRYALTNESHNENTLLTKGRDNTLLSWLAKRYKMGGVRYTSPNVKAIAENAIYMII